MINESKLAEMRTVWDALGDPTFKDIADTLDFLWKIARMTRRWQNAAPGRESSELENVLFKMIKELPPAS